MQIMAGFGHEPKDDIQGKYRRCRPISYIKLKKGEISEVMSHPVGTIRFWFSMWSLHIY